MLSSDESPEYVRKLKQTVRPLANIAAYNNNLKTKTSSASNESIRENLHRIKKICLI